MLTPRQRCQGPQVPTSPRALVFLRHGLTPTLHWAHALLCATSCPAGEGWLERGNGRGLVDDFLVSGDLIRPLPTTVRTEFGYYLIVRDDRPLSSDMEAFVNWVFEAQRKAREDPACASHNFGPAQKS